ncbi:hypothetical protein [Streptococcus uberis]|uniref:hypothetical protein n=1 Tax=Streptococcus uberis TaxID=1349 RepID=UPI00193BAF13|nr:hypothetical protein [Streptococcus uberis]
MTTISRYQTESLVKANPHLSATKLYLRRLFMVTMFVTFQTYKKPINWQVLHLIPSY